MTDSDQSNYGECDRLGAIHKLGDRMTCERFGMVYSPVAHEWLFPASKWSYRPSDQE